MKDCIKAFKIFSKKQVILKSISGNISISSWLSVPVIISVCLVIVGILL
jgi:hypothetical protein